jgi:hypothetical protein
VAFGSSSQNSSTTSVFIKPHFFFLPLFLFCSGDPKRDKTWTLVGFLVKSGFYHLDRVVGMDGHYIPRVVRETHKFFQLPGSELG